MGWRGVQGCLFNATPAPPACRFAMCPQGLGYLRLLRPRGLWRLRWFLRLDLVVYLARSLHRRRLRFGSFYLTFQPLKYGKRYLAVAHYDAGGYAAQLF